jgi:ArsR family metal-binding transcriptional regulator
MTSIDIYELKNSALAGETNALSAYVVLKEFEKDVADALEKLKELALEEAKTYEEKTFEVFGAKITVKNGAGRWKFDHIQDWNTAKNELSEIEKAAKQAYQNQGVGIMSIRDGEIMEAADYTEGKEQISVTLSK